MPTWALFLLATAVTALVIDLVRRARLPRRSFRGKHVVVTGGSAGIGKAIATELLAKGARVTLLARTKSKLEAAVTELSAKYPAEYPADTSAVQYVCASTTDSDQLKAAMATATATFGPADVLVANAGTAAPGLFLDMPVSTFESQMDLNYLGTVRSIKAVLPEMVEQRSGQIIIVASGAAACTFLGYSSYAPSKWAVRALADTLRNELCGFGISVHIGYPPDTDTPGFEHENTTKPPETAAMIPVDVYPASKVARWMLNGAETGLYHLPCPDLTVNLLVSSVAGVTPRAYPLLEAALLPLTALVEAVVCLYFDFFGRKLAKRITAEQAKKSR